MKILPKLFAAFIATLGIAAVTANPSAYADDSLANGFIVSPTYQRIILRPGETYTGSINVTNPVASTENLDYKVSVGPYNVIDKTYESDLDSITSYNQITDWISFYSDTGTVAPNDTDTIYFTITVPYNAPAGGQYATINVQQDHKTNSGQGLNIQNTFGIASIIYASVAGNTVETGSVLENSMPIISFTTPFAATSTVQNTGNVHSDATYTLKIYSAFSDELIYTSEENPDVELIMPETTHYYSTKWQDAPAVGIFKAEHTVKYLDDISTVEKVVVVCPLWLIATILGAIILIIVTIVAKVKANNRRNHYRR